MSDCHFRSPVPFDPLRAAGAARGITNANMVIIARCPEISNGIRDFTPPFHPRRPGLPCLESVKIQDILEIL
jgi:hypothetical protein